MMERDGGRKEARIEEDGSKEDVAIETRAVYTTESRDMRKQVN